MFEIDGRGVLVSVGYPNPLRWFLIKGSKSPPDPNHSPLCSSAYERSRASGLIRSFIFIEIRARLGDVHPWTDNKWSPRGKCQPSADTVDALIKHTLSDGGKSVGLPS